MPFREATLKTLVVCGAASVLITETLSAFHMVTRTTLILGWIAVIAAAVTMIRPAKPQLHWGLIPIAVIAAIVGLTAVLSAPNSADAMAYHLPRVIYWVQNKSVQFFPTPYLNQIMLQPFAEYAMLHTYLLTGGDRFVNLVQFTGFIGSIAGVSGIAAELGLDRRAQIVAALVCATLPNGILQASGAKNDWMLTLWLIAMLYFVLRGDALFAAVALALALGTKATAYLFAPFFLIAVWRKLRARDAAIAAAAVLLLNGPQYFRNHRLSGSLRFILGFDSAQGDGFYRWRNESFGWRETVSNLLRNTSEQLGARSERWNQGVYAASLSLHQALRINPQDPATTWRFTHYEAPLNANHEANANNRWHLGLLLAAIGAAALGVIERRWLIYAIAPVGGFVAFCFYLKWQPFLGRLELPLFVIAAPLIARILAPQRLIMAAVCLFLLSSARLPLIENWTRPLRGPNNLFHQPRELQYFNDMGQWHNRDTYFAEVERIAATGCRLVGVDINENQLEYPFQALLLRKNPQVRFVHVNVSNPSARYAATPQPEPCAVFRVR